MSHRELRLNSRRLLLAMAIAVAIHAGLFFLIPLVVRLERSRKPEYGGTVLVQLEEPAPAQAVVPAPEPLPVAQPAPAPKPAPTPKPAPREQPATRTAATVRAPVQAAAKVPVQPAPAPLPTGPAFKEAGGKTGVVQPLATPEPLGSIPAAKAVPGPEPTLPGAGAPSGAAAASASVQKAGVAVAVPAQPAKTTGAAGSPTDYGTLDKALAGSAKTGTTAAKSAADAAADARDFSVVWDEPDAGKGRDLIDRPRPTLPKRVEDEGLTLYVTVFFAVAPNGVVAQARVARSSGYSDVDAAVLEAVRRWRFRAAETTRTVRGTIPYTIRAR
ncbi:MAG: TonB family protein [Spirochaetes bacterium]|nr:TonB family protein [Spirochaetota bacterium]